MSQTRELSPAGSLEREDDTAKDEKKTKSRRPPNTAFRQQRLKAWQPILTPKTVLPLFFIVGVIFAPIGGLLLYASNQVQELSIDYTDCLNKAPNTFGPIEDGRVTHQFKSSGSAGGNDADEVMWKRELIQVGYGKSKQHKVPTYKCTLKFNIPNDIGPPVLMYYRLTKFYQNHRRYVKSFDQEQLQGHYRSNSSIESSSCDPLTTNATDGNQGWAYYPCGLIANSLFNDTIFSPVWLNVQNSDRKSQTYEMTEKGIGWSSDADLYAESPYKPYEVTPPPAWKKRYPDGYNDEFPIPNLHEMESFWVWMRTAGLPTFSKLARRNDDTAMKQGWYELDIYDDFPVQQYGGTKEILISTRTIMGGKNPFLGIAYVVVGGICVLLGALFTAAIFIKPRKLGDHTYLTWNNDQSAAAAR